MARLAKLAPKRIKFKHRPKRKRKEPQTIVPDAPKKKKTRVVDEATLRRLQRKAKRADEMLQLKSQRKTPRKRKYKAAEYLSREGLRKRRKEALEQFATSVSHLVRETAEFGDLTEAEIWNHYAAILQDDLRQCEAEDCAEDTLWTSCSLESKYIPEDMQVHQPLPCQADNDDDGMASVPHDGCTTSCAEEKIPVAQLSEHQRLFTTVYGMDRHNVSQKEVDVLRKCGHVTLPSRGKTDTIRARLNAVVEDKFETQHEHVNVEGGQVHLARVSRLTKLW